MPGDTRKNKPPSTVKTPIYGSAGPEPLASILRRRLAMMANELAAAGDFVWAAKFRAASQRGAV